MLYKELTIGKALRHKTFGVWVLVFIYQAICQSNDPSGGIVGLTNIPVGILWDEQKPVISLYYIALTFNKIGYGDAGN